MHNILINRGNNRLKNNSGNQRRYYHGVSGHKGVLQIEHVSSVCKIINLRLRISKGKFGVFIEESL